MKYDPQENGARRWRPAPAGCGFPCRGHPAMHVCASLAPRPLPSPHMHPAPTAPAPRAPLCPCQPPSHPSRCGGRRGDPCRRAAPGKAVHRWRWRSHGPRGPKTLRSHIPWALVAAKIGGLLRPRRRGPRGARGPLRRGGAAAALPRRRALPTEEL